MKKGIHPHYHIVDVVMTDGTTYKTRSCYRENKMVLEIDSKSHPFFTGKQMLMDSAGRVDRFNKRLQKANSFKDNKKGA